MSKLLALCVITITIHYLVLHDARWLSYSLHLIVVAARHVVLRCCREMRLLLFALLEVLYAGVDDLVAVITASEFVHV